MNKVRFSLFTSTYNRGHLLPRVFNSLLRQTYNNFEWVIIDDGSTDNTAEVVASFIKFEKILIKYLRKKNEGKHTAWKIATPLFLGDYVISIDSDDELAPMALEIFNKHWKILENSKNYDLYWEVKARAINDTGKLIGKPLPSKIFDEFSYVMTYKKRFINDLHGCRKLSAMKNEAKVPDQFIFQKYVSNFPESIRWHRAGKIYLTRYIDEITEIVHYPTDDRLSTNTGKRTISKTYNNLIGAKYAIEEDRYYMYKWDFVSYLIGISAIVYTSICLKINPFKIIDNIKKMDLLFISLLYSPLYILYQFRK